MASFWQRLRRAFADDTVQSEAQTTGTAVHFEPVGTSGTSIYSGYMNEEYLQELRGRPAADIYDQMRRGDPKVRMILSAVKDPIRSAHWSVQPATDTPEGKHQADLIDQILFKDLDRTWQQQLSEMLTFLDFGFSVFEVTNRVVMNHPKFGNYMTIQKLGWRSPRTIERWNVDSKGILTSISQYAYGDLQRLVDIPADFLLLFTNEKEGDEYDGVSALRPCYGPWKRKQNYLRNLAVGIEKFAVPTPILTVPAGQESSPETVRAKEVLRKWISHQQQWITKPSGYELEFHKTEFDPDPILNAIGKEDAAMAYAFLENFLELGQSGSGSYALSMDLSDFFLSSIEHVAMSICDTINKKLIPDMIKLNIGPQDEYPKLIVSGIKDKPGKEFAEVLNLLTQSKIVVADDDLEKQVRQKYGLSLKSTLGQRVQEEPKPFAAPAFAEVRKFAENGEFKIQAIDVSKKIAVSKEDAVRIVAEFGLVSQNVIESENAYRFQQCRPEELVEGTLRSFEAMEGVTIYYGRQKPTVPLT